MHLVLLQSLFCECLSQENCSTQKHSEQTQLCAEDYICSVSPCTKGGNSSGVCTNLWRSADLSVLRDLKCNKAGAVLSVHFIAEIPVVPYQVGVTSWSSLCEQPSAKLLWKLRFLNLMPELRTLPRYSVSIWLANSATAELIQGKCLIQLLKMLRWSPVCF